MKIADKEHKGVNTDEMIDIADKFVVKHYKMRGVIIYGPDDREIYRWFHK